MWRVAGLFFLFSLLSIVYPVHSPSLLLLKNRDSKSTWNWRISKHHMKIIKMWQNVIKELGNNELEKKVVISVTPWISDLETIQSRVLWGREGTELWRIPVSHLRSPRQHCLPNLESRLFKIINFFSITVNTWYFISFSCTI